MANETKVFIPCFEGINKMAISENEKMLVKITKCDAEGAKYSSMIDETIEVSYFPTDRLSFSIPEENFQGYISIEDTDLSDGKQYTIEEVINSIGGKKKKEFFINICYGNNQAAIISFNEKTGMFEDFSRKEIRYFSPLDLFERSIRMDKSRYDGTFYCHCHDRWTKLTRNFFSLKIE